MIFYARCPRDANVFPEMQAEQGTRNLFADFKAFRFPSTATVNFVATVQFCQDLCQPVSIQHPSCTIILMMMMGNQTTDCIN